MGIAAGYEKSVVGSDGEEEGLILAMEGREVYARGMDGSRRGYGGEEYMGGGLIVDHGAGVGEDMWRSIGLEILSFLDFWSFSFVSGRA